MEVVIGCIGLGVTIVGSAVGIGIKMGSLTTTVKGLDAKISEFIDRRNGGTQCQRHEDAIKVLEREMKEVKHGD